MSFTTDYEVKDCVRVAQKIKVTLNSIAVDDAGGDGGNDLEIYGSDHATRHDGRDAVQQDRAATASRSAKAHSIGGGSSRSAKP